MSLGILFNYEVLGSLSGWSIGLLLAFSVTRQQVYGSSPVSPHNTLFLTMVSPKNLSTIFWNPKTLTSNLFKTLYHL